MKTIKLHQCNSETIRRTKKPAPTNLITYDTWEGYIYQGSNNNLRVMFSPYIALLYKKHHTIKTNIKFPSWKKRHVVAVCHEIDMVVTAIYYKKGGWSYQEKSVFEVIVENESDCIRLLNHLKKYPDFSLSEQSLAYLKTHYDNVLMSVWFLKKKKKCTNQIIEICAYFGKNPCNETFFIALNGTDKLCLSVYLKFFKSKHKAMCSISLIQRNQVNLPPLFKCLWYLFRGMSLDLYRKNIEFLLNNTKLNNH